MINIKKLEKEWYRKAEKCKALIRNLLISNYEIYIDTIKIYEKEKNLLSFILKFIQ